MSEDIPDIVIPIAITLTLIFTPLVRLLAEATGALDYPDNRKIHSRPIPRMGGLAIIASFYTTIFLCSLLGVDLLSGRAAEGIDPRIIGFLAASFLMVCLGIVDDIKGVPAVIKLIVQCAAATILYVSGIQIGVISDPISGSPLSISWASYPLTLLWIVGITNAFNLIDGLDGLAAGVGAIGSATIGVVAIWWGDVTGALLAFSLTGALLGFLPHNFYPARVFMGDVGSLTIGFTIASLGIMQSAKQSSAFAIAIPVLAFAVPIFDTLMAILRRCLPSRVGRGENSFRELVRRIFSPDRNHLHHRLLQAGISHPRAVLTLYTVSCLFAFGALGMTLENAYVNTGILVGALVVTGLGVRRFALPGAQIPADSNGWSSGVFGIAGRRVPQTVMDVAAMLMAAFSAQLLTGFLSDSPLPISSEILGVVLIQTIIYGILGVFKVVPGRGGFGEKILVVKAALTSILLLGGFWLLVVESPGSLFAFVLLDFFILSTLSLLSRYFWRGYPLPSSTLENDPRRRALVIGTGPAALAAMRMLEGPLSLDHVMVGFLDENPRLEGKTIESYPVMGGHLRAQTVVKRFRIQDLIIAEKDIDPHVIRRLQALARLERVSLLEFRTILDTPPLADETTRPGEGAPFHEKLPMKTSPSTEFVLSRS